MVLKIPLRFLWQLKHRESRGINCKHRGLLNVPHGSCSHPFPTWRGFFFQWPLQPLAGHSLTGPMVENQEEAAHPFPQLKIRGNTFTIHLPVTFYRNIRLTIFSMIISLRIRFLLYSHSRKNRSSVDSRKAGSARGADGSTARPAQWEGHR